MYLRHSRIRKDGKTHTYWRLVRSVRRHGRVVQETVAQLGELDAEGRAKARALARTITGGDEQRELFEAPAHEGSVPVRLREVRLERGRSFGEVWLGWTLWRALKLDTVCAELLPAGREAVPWSVMAAVLVIARLCEPSSELHIAENWYRRTALEDLLGLSNEGVNDDRLYRALDRLLPHKPAIERHLKARLGELFALEYDLLLYDVTSTYFEGLAEGNALAQRGYSRDHRPDCKQVCIALVVTREGIPLGYEVFAGNRVDVTTVEEIVEAMETRFGLAQRIWVMDRGMVSEDNLAWLQQSGRRYLIGTARGEVRKWSRQLAEERDWQTVRDGVEAKLCRGPDGAETFLLCRSRERREKERGMHARFAARIEAALEKLGRRIARAKRPLDRSALERQIGRLLERNVRASARYQIGLEAAPDTAAGLRLVWSAQTAWDEWARHSEGSYVLRTNVSDWTPESLWQTYMQLTEAEAAFRIQKGELGLRPIWHQKAERVEAHILVCFLGYVMWKTLEQWQKRAGLGHSPRTILAELGRIQSSDVVLPL
ncbi:MAG TPA: IS1634 family transposase, partial [Roseiflexaceae bacterium]